MLRRKIDQELIKWHRRTSFKPALLLLGARQVGKTTSVRTFGRQYYESVIEMNFEEQPSLKRIFAGDLNIESIVEKISVAGLGRLVASKTLLFLDEIQSCPSARTALKFIVEDGRFDVIASGSLLGLHYREVSSYPVGFEHKVEMHSLDFEEFLWANGITDATIEALRQSYEQRKPVAEYIHQRMMEMFKRYMIVGGMPRVVSSYVHDKDIGEVLLLQRSITESYRDDISKYAGKRKGEAKRVFDAIPMQLTQRNKKFKVSQVEEGGRLRTYEDALEWLHDAGIASFCHNVANVELPFALNARASFFKFFMRDTGLLSSMSMGNAQSAILNGDLSINEGAIVENCIADLLVKRGYPLFYWDIKGRLEVDFLIQKENTIVPIEVKSGRDYRRHASLDRLMATSSRHEKRALVLSPYNVEVAEQIDYLPLYMVMFL